MDRLLVRQALRAPVVALACSVFAALSAIPACTSAGAPARYDPKTVEYNGVPYGDFLVLAAGVRQCMHSNEASLPRIILINGTFECYTTSGWQQVYGCSGHGEVFLDAAYLVATKGALWSHELTHYFGTTSETSPCGHIAIEGFSIDRGDAGTRAM